MTPQKLVDFTNKDGNILLLTAPSATPEQARELARELDIDLPPRDFVAVDHFNADTLAEENSKHDLILIPRPARSDKSQNYFSPKGFKNDAFIAFRGAGHSLGNRPLLFPILSASRTAYTYDTKEEFGYAEDPSSAGTQMHYVTGLQARNNARVTVAGSVDMFSDEFFGMEVKPAGGEVQGTANRAFAREISQWTFKEIGIVKVVEVRHYLANRTDAEVNPHMYRVKNDVVSMMGTLREIDADRDIDFQH